MLPTITGEFRVVEDPELRFTPSGMAIAHVRLVASSRKKNDADEWVDDKTLWIDGTAFKQMAENMVESLRKSDLVEIRGRILTEQWENKDGEKRSKISLTIDAIAPSLRFKAVLHSDGKGGKVTREGATTDGSVAAPAADDPWATPTSSDEPPF